MYPRDLKPKRGAIDVSRHSVGKMKCSFYLPAGGHFAIPADFLEGGEKPESFHPLDRKNAVFSICNRITSRFPGRGIAPSMPRNLKLNLVKISNTGRYLARFDPYSKLLFFCFDRLKGRSETEIGAETYVTHFTLFSQLPGLFSLQCRLP